ncbi:hypothetical protein [Arcobacter vandammei]|uniref:hypothetical protein n=1 Tax=Arcobacter vandammei TaxID=2782243 RepID=UPI0018DFA328|nr:hypothetical protein [Arcobacter vandammei]
MDNLKNCESLTKLGQKAIKKAFNEFADFDENRRNEIFKRQRVNFHKLKDIYKNYDNETLSQSALIISIREYINSLPPEKLQMEKHKKIFRQKTNKEMLLLEHWAIIREAILMSNMSFRELTQFLGKKYNVEVNHSYLYQIWKKIEGDKI